ncbi:hypothetical protein B0H19DRAFT_1088439, partial [Mycena capillaripes]
FLTMCWISLLTPTTAGLSRHSTGSPRVFSAASIPRTTITRTATTTTRTPTPPPSLLVVPRAAPQPLPTLQIHRYVMHGRYRFAPLTTRFV